MNTALSWVRKLKDSSPRPLDSSVARASVMPGQKGLIRSSIVTVARELKADEIVLQ